MEAAIPATTKRSPVAFPGTGNWSSAPLKLAFAFYRQTPFGKLHSRYMYRDAANYKAGGQLLLDGEYS